jgi:cytochrome c oxidase cbb3-type subunit 1
MVAGLSKGDRQVALAISILIALCGLALAAVGRGDPIGTHGFIILLYALGVSFFVIAGYYAPQPDISRLARYYDDPTKVGIVLAMGWAVFGLAFGVWVAALLAWPDLTFDAGWASFGRIRPVHTTSVIFGFGGNALIATSFHVLQRTSRARLPEQISPWFVLLGYNLFCVIAVSGYFIGVTQSKEYAEPEWYADIFLVVVWVVYSSCLPRTLLKRKEPHIYVANWFYLAFIVTIAMLHIVNNLPMPVSFLGSKSYSAVFRRAGCDDPVVVWPQRGRLLPDRRLPRHDVLLRAQAGRPARSIPTGCRSSFLGASSSSTSGPARITCTTRPCPMGADARHGVLDRAAGCRPGAG